MKRKILGILGLLFVLLPCLFMFSACDNNQVIGVSVKINGEDYSTENNTIIMTYGNSFDFDSAIKIEVKFKDNSTNAITFTTAKEYNLNIDCEIDEYPNAGTYDINISHDLIEDIKIRLIVAKKDLNMENVRWDYSDSFTYDGNLHEVSLINLPNEISVSYENNKFINAGEYEAVATLQYDVSNYNLVNFNTPLNLSWEINKSVIDLSNVTWNYTAPYIYDGISKLPELQNLPNGVIASYTYLQDDVETEPINAGNYISKVSLNTVNENFVLINNNINDLDFVIEKQTLTKDDFIWNISNGGSIDYDGQEKRVEIINNYSGLVEINYINDNQYCNFATEEGRYTAYASVTLTELGELNYFLNFDDGIIFEWKIMVNYFNSIFISSYEDEITFEEFKNIGELEVGTTIILNEKEGYFAFINSAEHQNSYLVTDNDIEIIITVQNDLGDIVYETVIMVI